MDWTEADIPDLSGKNILVTGANTGIGFHAAKLFARNKARVILACRTPTKMAAAASAIQSEAPGSKLVQLQVDLSDLDSVRAFVDSFRAANIPQLDVILLNAGAFLVDYQVSPQGIETMFATNHLGHFLLVGLLLDYIKNVPDSRIIAVSSLGHLFVKTINYEQVRSRAPDPNASYEYLGAYGETKLANQWFIQVLNSKLRSCGGSTVAVAAHPGCSTTDLTRHASRSWFIQILVNIFKFINQPSSQGAWPLVFAVTDPKIRPDNYYGPAYLFGSRGPPIRNSRVNSCVKDLAKAEELWAISEELCGFAYDI